VNKARNTVASTVRHYRKKLIRGWPEAVGLGLKCRRLSLTRRLFSDAVGSGAVGVVGRRVSVKCRRVRLTRRPQNAVGLGYFQFFQKNPNFEKIQILFFIFFFFSFLFSFL
jgi:hypothetical protein